MEKLVHEMMREIARQEMPLTRIELHPVLYRRLMFDMEPHLRFGSLAPGLEREPLRIHSLGLSVEIVHAHPSFAMVLR